jgi:rfaE bifunctional protein nucleotidyltransferase chain/domain
MKSKNKIVLAGGCFDILHYGHLYFLKRAKHLGDILIVAIESDKRIRELKGRGRPIHTEEQRKEMLESLQFIDKVIVLKDKMTDRDYLDFVVKVHPSIIAVTEGDAVLEKKKKQAKIVGAGVIEIPKIKALSTSQISKLLKLD